MTALRQNGLALSDRDYLCRDVVVLYRHTRSMYADRLIHGGEVRLTNVMTYRDTVAFGTEIGDSAEGQKTRDTVIDRALTDEHGNIQGDQRIRQLIPTMGRARNAAFVNIRFENERITGPPSLCWCLTSSSDLAIAKQMSPDYDATVEVRFTVDLLVEIRLALEAAGFVVRGVGLGRVAYVPARHTGDKSPFWHYPPTMIKDERYAYQHEWRVIVECTGAPPLPSTVDIRIPSKTSIRRLA